MSKSDFDAVAMDISIPNHRGLLLGRSVDMKSILLGRPSTDTESVTQQINRSTHQCSIPEKLKDVCDILRIPPEYALKVKSERITNEIVEACLEGLRDDYSFTIIVRSCFVQYKRYCPKNYTVDIRKNPNAAKLLGDAVGDNTENDQSSMTSVLQRTHLVKAMEHGNELITVTRVFIDRNHNGSNGPSAIRNLEKLREKAREWLWPNSSDDSSKSLLEALQKTARKFHQTLSKQEYGHIALHITYGCFTKLDKYPQNLPEMVNIVKNFMDQCTEWEQNNEYDPEKEDEYHSLLCEDGSGEHEKMVTSLGPPSISTHSFSDDESSDEDLQDYVVLESSETKRFYGLRVTLQPSERVIDGETDHDRSLAPNQYSQATYSVFERLFKALLSVEEAKNELQAFLARKPVIGLEKRIDQVKAQIQRQDRRLMKIVDNLDFVHAPSEETMEDVLSLDLLQTVEDVTSGLPPGSDIELLLIGKTGHGKSSTGNSILGQDIFVTSASGDSATKETNVWWAQVDCRNIKVIDTPGVSGTDLDSSDSMIDHAIHSISDAIARCPDGFHALLLVIRYGCRMTLEEKKAIDLLKRVMGECILKSHCVCVITYGDNFESDAPEGDFITWCKHQTGFLGSLFEECSYRCVLFNNKTTDARAQKSQLRRLVAMVDSLPTRYTNDLFKLAKEEREASEIKMPEVNEDLIRDIQLVLNSVNKFVNNINYRGRYEENLIKLKEDVDNLRNRVSEEKYSHLEFLKMTVHELADTVYAKIAETTACSEPDVSNDSADVRNEKTDVRISENFIIELGTHSKTLQSWEEKVKKTSETFHSPVIDELKKQNCFPGNSTVTLASGKFITLEELRIGDEVLVRDKAGKFAYDTVYMFGHREVETDEEFIVFNTAQHKVSVTKGHYVYCQRDGQELCIAAEQVSRKDCLLIASTEGFIPQPVENITYQRMRGLFAPFTYSGTIIVDNALMSCYIDVLKPTTCHTLMWPVRQLARLSPRTLASINGSPVEHPVPLWVKAVLKLL